MKAFLFTGLGADHRLFNHIHLNGLETIYVPYILPSSEEETIESYAPKLLNSLLLKPQKGDILLGVSLGGVMATEMAKKLEGVKVILISSAKTKLEFPGYFSIFNYFNPEFINPANVFKNISNLINPFMGFINDEEQDLCVDMMKKVDLTFFNWSKRAVVKWENTVPPKDFIHIHGTKDLVFPIENIKNALKIPNGTHFMVYTQGKLISEIILERLGF